MGSQDRSYAEVGEKVHRRCRACLFKVLICSIVVYAMHEDETLCDFVGMPDQHDGFRNFPGCHVARVPSKFLARPPALCLLWCVPMGEVKNLEKKLKKAKVELELRTLEASGWQT